MADYGLQTWDENGNPMLRVTDRISRFLGVFDTGTVAGAHGDARLSLGTPYFTVLDGAVFNATTCAPRIFISSSQITWDFSSGVPGRSVRVAYGVY